MGRRAQKYAIQIKYVIIGQYLELYYSIRKKRKICAFTKEEIED